jgi:hypothetical protein
VEFYDEGRRLTEPLGSADRAEARRKQNAWPRRFALSRALRKSR